ncbi:mannose-6-phosphate receptor binding protein 1 isoform X1 [Pangasianodon hypophthalmus]|uniref:mannose-6-phosphate receptor binding protein 1 isoform X1 n=1 Tax=Pangasianodon hypophthalmus TaxID=310915 RepID=UPI0023071472|nr:mannose-6-phosphate receptor binding protein 1 isoform X1 [Pangasianodon hypophthalmus]
MAENGKHSEMDTETPSASQETQSVMSRVSNLALVSSACDAVSSAYSSTKESIPVLRGVMDAAESGVRTLSTAASSGTKPILNKLEPQIAMVNEYAMKGLDKMEEKLPVLHQPADKLVSETVGKVYQCVSGAKDAVVGAMMGGVEMTRTALSGGINTVMGSRVGQMVSSGVGLALNRSEDCVEQKLPLTETELAAVAEPLPKDEVETSLSNEGVASQSSAPSYFVRLGKLSAQVQERALELSLIKASVARDATHKAVSQITSTLDLLENLRGANTLGRAPEQLLKRWREWRQEGQEEHRQGHGAESTEEDGGEDGKENGEQLEWRALSMVRALSEQLRVACSGVVSSVQGLPSTVQEQLQNARHSAEELHSSLGKTKTVTPLLLQQSRNQLTQVRQSLDGVMEYLLNNTPLNWLVGPFSPQLTEKQPSAE